MIYASRTDETTRALPIASLLANIDVRSSVGFTHSIKILPQIVSNGSQVMRQEGPARGRGWRDVGIILPKQRGPDSYLKHLPELCFCPVAAASGIRIQGSWKIDSLLWLPWGWGRPQYCTSPFGCWWPSSTHSSAGQ